MTEQNSGIYNFTKPVVLAHPKNLFTARPFIRKGKPVGENKYSGDFLFPPDHPDLAGIKAKVRALAEAAWPGVSPGDLNLPWYSGDKRADAAKEKAIKDGKDPARGEYQRGQTVIVARSKYQPVISVVRDGKIVDLNSDTIRTAEKEFYFGVEVLAQLNFETYDVDGKRGITAYLNSVVSLNRGKRIGSQRVPPSETFKGYAGFATPEDPTAGDDAPTETEW